MIGSMQDFNFGFGNNSYIKFDFDFSSLVGNQYLRSLRISFGPSVLSFNPSFPNANIKFYVDGLEQNQGIPSGGSSSWLKFDAPNIPSILSVELRSDGEYLERLETTQSISSALFRNYKDVGGSLIELQSMRFISSIDISDGSGFTRLGQWCLQDMRNINNLILPSTTTTIVNRALANFNPYGTIICKSRNPPNIESTSLNVTAIFGELSSSASKQYQNVTLYVPKGCAAIYKQPTINGVANDWSNIQHIEELDY